ncbi:hypothetical protein AM1BK_29550 [Neobacillus kokaensis]|uniref:Uncharacterized protein n=1 Tax=Neobacillus kokaensis TaxID=2759023 RepID=A0ABQ3N743_9BACI|nr:hypothetical protein AM1BK_29550 [Neobacillus kokaensis]
MSPKPLVGIHFVPVFVELHWSYVELYLNYVEKVLNYVEIIAKIKK